ncbi:SRPBCC family protein [Asanoa sp. NPDC049573]|uniref:SRPBCC family protein n=1 Tax=Asanoa sp. NPDC049573 TaxID=3155396 RepID=UPI003437E09F
MDIDRQAPAVVEVERIIRAPLATLWNLHADIDGWPRWNRHISSANLRDPIGAGATFDWETEGLTITSTITEYEPMRRIAWTGTASGIEARHTWTFTPRSEHAVLVHTAESWNGEPVRADPGAMRAALDGSLQGWLTALESESERVTH